MEVLRQHRLEQRKWQLAVASWENDVDRVFTMRTGRMVYPQYVLANAKRLSRKADVPVTDVHSQRHTYATQALMAGVHVNVVSERIGHADPAITLSIYAHVTREQHREGAATAAAAILGHSAHPGTSIPPQVAEDGTSEGRV